MPKLLNSDTLKNPLLLQIVLAVVLISLVSYALFSAFQGNSNTNNPTYTQISRKVTFEEAAQTFASKTFQVYTRGSIIVKDDTKLSSTVTPTATSSVIPSTNVTAVENKYDDLFFYIDKSQVKRIDTRTYGQNESLYYNEKGEIVYLSNTSRSYTIYPVPADDEKNAILLFNATKEVLQTTFPLVPLLQEYKEGKFFPIERATNLYSGKWKHPLFTSNEIVDVFIETDPLTGNFRSFLVGHSFTQTISQVYFDFKEFESGKVIEVIPTDYKKVEVKSPYKIKQ